MKTTIPLTLGLFLFLALAPRSWAADCTGLWEEFLSEPYKGELFPDLGAHYWRYRFEIPAGASIGLRVRGRFAHARYVSFDVYDQATLNSVGTLPDREIHPRPGSRNPFREGVSRDVPLRNYTVWLLPPGMKPGARRNVMHFAAPVPEAAFQGVEFWYRVYRSDSAADPLGGTGLPEITAFDALTGADVACPPQKVAEVPIGGAMANLPPDPKGGRIRFFATLGANLYPNPDNHYVIAPLDFAQGETALFRVKVPSYFDSSDPKSIFHSGTEVRYWSVCLSGIPSTATSDCLTDKEATVDAHGYVTIAVGSRRIEKVAKAHGVNFIWRGLLSGPILLYRHLLTHRDFAGDFSRIPTWPQPSSAPAHTAETLDASQFVGDFAPTGYHCSTETFVKELESGSSLVCGVPIR